MAAGACQWSGAAMTTPLTSLRSRTRRKSFSAFAGFAWVGDTAFIPLASAFSSGSQMKPTSTPGMRLNIFACWAPRPLVPMMASTMRSLAPWA